MNGRWQLVSASIVENALRRRRKRAAAPEGAERELAQFISVRRWLNVKTRAGVAHNPSAIVIYRSILWSFLVRATAAAET